MRQVVVVGGGISGLAAAYRLVRLRDQHGLDFEVTLLEASSRLGGKIRTERVGTQVVEAGPDSFLTTKPEAVQLAREIGLGSRLLPTATYQKDVYVYLRGALRKLPEGLMLMAPTRVVPFLRSDLMSMRGKLRMGLERLLPPGGGGDESLADFTRRRLGQEALESIVEPLLAGIYAGDAEQMSLKSTFPQFAEMERRYGSVIRGLRAQARGPRPAGSGLTPFASFMGGLEEFVEALGRGLGEASLKTGVPVRRVTKAGQGFRLETAGGDLPADAVLLAAPAPDVANALEGTDPDLAGRLRQIPAVSTATLTFGFAPKDLPALPTGFGFVIPKGAGRSINAVTFVSQKFPQRPNEFFLIRCFAGGAGKEGELDRTDDELRDRALGDLGEILGIKTRPEFVRIFRWDKANPQYTVGHDARIDGIEEALRRHPGLALAGAYYRGVGIPDCIRSANDSATTIVNSLKK